MSDPDDPIPLAMVCRTFSAMTGDVAPFDYRKLLGGCVDGVLRAQRVNGRWNISRRDIPDIPDLFDAASRKRHQQHPVEVVA